MLEDADNARHSIKDAVSTSLRDAVFENLYLTAIQELDELSTHTRVDGHKMDEIRVRRLDGAEIEYCVTGEVEVELQYGSNSDVEDDFGMRLDDSYPYKARVIAAAGKPLDIDAEAIQLRIDTSSFYE
nr:hypothetical protein [Acetobacter syzygii]